MITVLTAVICLSGFQLWQISAVYISEARIRDGLSTYSPDEAKDDQAPEDSSLDGLEMNRRITDMQKEVNKDIVGWLRIPDTRIDYPFVQGEENEYYLKRDLYGNSAAAGTLFMDSRCTKGFSGFNTIIYGHNMKNGSMFGDLYLYADEWFFNENSAGTIFLKDKVYKLEIFAYMVVRADDKIIYDPMANRNAFYNYVRENARNYKEPENGKNIVILSTCAYNFNGARIVVIANTVNVRS